MTEIIQEILQDDKLKIIETNNITLLFQGFYPEDCVEIEINNNYYMIHEVHRKTKYLKLKTKEKSDAIVYAIILYKRLYDNLLNGEISKNIKVFMDNRNEEKALECIKNKFSPLIYSLEREERGKISFIKVNNKVDVKFNKRYIAKGAKLDRAYIVFYNFCAKLEHISLFCDILQNKLGNVINRDRIFDMYLFGE